MNDAAFITGASGGVGQATARLFLERNWCVIATARDPDSLGDLKHHPRLTRIGLDVTDQGSIKDAVREAIERHGRIDVLINNAGIGVAGPLEGVSEEAIRRVFDTNFFGSVALIREIVPHMRERRSGTIVNVSSVAGRIGIPFHSLYCATKFALEGLTESLAYELLQFDIRLKLVEPGGIRTNFRTQWFEPDAYQPQVTRLKIKMEEGIKKAASPMGVAEVIHRAATDRGTRMRFPANGAGAPLLFRRLLPDGAMQALLRRTVNVID